MSRHSTEDVEALAATLADKLGGEAELTERYRPRITRCRVLWEVQVVTTHTIRAVGETPKEVVIGVVETHRDRPAYVLSERWARWKARRMVAAAHRRDVREGQPWAVQQ